MIKQSNGNGLAPYETPTLTKFLLMADGPFAGSQGISADVLNDTTMDWDE